MDYEDHTREQGLIEERDALKARVKELEAEARSRVAGPVAQRWVHRARKAEARVKELRERSEKAEARAKVMYEALEAIAHETGSLYAAREAARQALEDIAARAAGLVGGGEGE